MKNQYYTIFIAIIIPFTSGFGTSFNAPSINSRISQDAPSLRNFKPPTLFVATASFVASTSDVDETDFRVISILDSQMKKMKREKDKMVEKMSKYETVLKELEKKKKRYLESESLGNTPVVRNVSETAVRSAVKALAWRIIAGSVTFMTSLQFSGSIATALSIVGSDFFSKAFTMFVGERIMNKSQAGRKTGADSAGRSVAKALIWRLFAICNTLSVSFFFAKDLKMASKIAGSDAIFKTALMVAYERAWAKIEWGKEYNIEFSI